MVRLRVKTRLTKLDKGVEDFQFQYGAVKSNGAVKSKLLFIKMTNQLSFNSNMVRLRDISGFVFFKLYTLSIPIWSVKRNRHKPFNSNMVRLRALYGCYL